mgnify:CR=1 FL=1
MITHKITHRSAAFDILVGILKHDFGIFVYEDDIAAPDRSFIVSDKPISDPDSVFQSFYTGQETE